MASLNDAMIKALAGRMGKDINDTQADQILQMTGGDEGAVTAYLQSGQTPGSNNNGGFQPLTPPDTAKLREQVYNTLQPYYVQLAKEAQGDFTRATQILQEDYTKGVRDQRIQFAFTQKQQVDDLKNTLATLGITNLQDQNSIIDKLNQRGMAVYQNNPDGTPNVLSPSTITSNTDTNVAPGESYNDTSTLTNPANSSMGRGGYELAQLQESQRLRQEAEQRAATKPIEQAGINLKQYTNTPTGVNPNLPPDQLAKALAAPGVDRSQLGTAERSLVTGEEQKTRDLQQTQEDLANQRAQDVNQIAAPLAATGTKALGSEMENQIQKEKQANFVSTGTA
jgi:hypothetical protein